MVIPFVVPYLESAGMVQAWVTSFGKERPESLISPGFENETAHHD